MHYLSNEPALRPVAQALGGQANISRTDFKREIGHIQEVTTQKMAETNGYLW